MFPIGGEKNPKKTRNKQISKLLFRGLVPNKSNWQKAYASKERKERKRCSKQEAGDGEIISSPVGKLESDGKVICNDGRRHRRQDLGAKPKHRQSQSIHAIYFCHRTREKMAKSYIKLSGRRGGGALTAWTRA